MKTILSAVENGLLPDPIAVFGARQLIRARLRSELRWDEEESTALLEKLKDAPLAVETDAANEQHYEIPAEFFKLCLGARRKYSGCYFPDGVHTLSQAEEASLKQVEERAGLEDGQEILELGCGWGSLTLWMAERFPNAKILAISNSASQREYIESKLEEMGNKNVQVQTCNVLDFKTERSFDRVVSIEMFEHMRNHDMLFGQIASWLKKEGRLFVHIFSHRHRTYLFNTEGDANWMGRYFFTGGMMPSASLFLNYQDDLRLKKQWWQSGKHYSKTADAWLQNLDRNRDKALPILAEVYGQRDAEKWLRRWRLFYIACRELFGFRDGKEWGVSHYLFEKRDV